MTGQPGQGAWHPDPMGRHELRYHDGTAWTDFVSTGGVQGTDPLYPVAPPAQAGGQASPGSAWAAQASPGNAATAQASPGNAATAQTSPGNAGTIQAPGQVAAPGSVPAGYGSYPGAMQPQPQAGPAGFGGAPAYLGYAGQGGALRPGSAPHLIGRSKRTWVLIGAVAAAVAVVVVVLAVALGGGGGGGGDHVNNPASGYDAKQAESDLGNAIIEAAAVYTQDNSMFGKTGSSLVSEIAQGETNFTFTGTAPVRSANVVLISATDCQADGTGCQIAELAAYAPGAGACFYAIVDYDPSYHGSVMGDTQLQGHEMYASARSSAGCSTTDSPVNWQGNGFPPPA